MSDTVLSYLKGIGIRVHTVRYQKVRKRLVLPKDNDADHSETDGATSKEYKRIRGMLQMILSLNFALEPALTIALFLAAEERRKNPPRKLVSFMHERDKYHHITGAIRPKLLSDAPGNLVLSHYAVTFEETLILRSTDLQLGDEGNN